MIRLCHMNSDHPYSKYMWACNVHCCFTYLRNINLIIYVCIYLFILMQLWYCYYLMQSVQNKVCSNIKVVSLIKSTLFLVEIHRSCGKSQPNWKVASIWFAFAHIELPNIIFGTVFVHHDFIKSRFPSYFCLLLYNEQLWYCVGSQFISVRCKIRVLKQKPVEKQGV